MRFRIRVRKQDEPTVLNTHDFDGWVVGHDEIMVATGGNPFYERGVVLYDSMDDRVVQYIRIKEQA